MPVKAAALPILRRRYKLLGYSVNLWHLLDVTGVFFFPPQWSVKKRIVSQSPVESAASKLSELFFLFCFLNLKSTFCHLKANQMLVAWYRCGWRRLLKENSAVLRVYRRVKASSRTDKFRAVSLSLHVNNTYFLLPVTVKSWKLLNISYETSIRQKPSQNEMNFNRTT